MEVLFAGFDDTQYNIVQEWRKLVCRRRTVRMGITENMRRVKANEKFSGKSRETLIYKACSCLSIPKSGCNGYMLHLNTKIILRRMLKIRI